MKRFLIGSLGFSGTRWMTQALRSCGINCNHEIYGDEYEGIVGNVGLLEKPELFTTMIHQVREPLRFAEALADRESKKLYLGPLAEKVRGEIGTILDVIPDEKFRHFVMCLMVWNKANKIIEAIPGMGMTFKVEDMRDLGEKFDEVLIALGYNPADQKPKLDFTNWDHRFTSRKHLPPPWKRDSLEWPSLEKWPELAKSIEEVKETAKRYGY